MQAGRIVGLGDGESLYRQPEHPFVAEFLGRVNRIERDQAARSSGRIRLGGAAWPCPPALLEHVAVLVRPEDVSVGPLQEAHARMTVSRRVFLGERVQLHLMPIVDTSKSGAGAVAHAALIAEVDRDHLVRQGYPVRRADRAAAPADA